MLSDFCIFILRDFLLWDFVLAGLIWDEQIADETELNYIILTFA